MSKDDDYPYVADHVRSSPVRRKNKFQAIKTKWEGILFDSMTEMKFFKGLAESAGKYQPVPAKKCFYLADGSILHIHVTIKLTPSVSLNVDGKLEKLDGSVVFLEVKGHSTPDWLTKKRLWMDFGPGPLQVWRRDLMLDEYFVHETVSEGTHVWNEKGRLGLLPN